MNHLRRSPRWQASVRRADGSWRRPYFMRLLWIPTSWVPCGSLRLTPQPSRSGARMGCSARRSGRRLLNSSWGRRRLPGRRSARSCPPWGGRRRPTTAVWSWISRLPPTLRRRRRRGQGSDRRPGPRRPRNGRGRRRGRGKPEVWKTPVARGAGGTRQGMRRCVGPLPAVVCARARLVPAAEATGERARRAGDSEEAWLSACGPKNDCWPYLGPRPVNSCRPKTDGKQNSSLPLLSPSPSGTDRNFALASIRCGAPTCRSNLWTFDLLEKSSILNFNRVYIKNNKYLFLYIYTRL